MNNIEQYQHIVDEAWKTFSEIRKTMLMLKPPASEDRLREYIDWYEQTTTQEEFINKCKTDNEFSEKWGLQIEERELSLEERLSLCREKWYDSWNRNFRVEDIEYRMNNEWNIPTKLITITYNDKTIESYD